MHLRSVCNRYNRNTCMMMSGGDGGDGDVERVDEF